MKGIVGHPRNVRTTDDLKTAITAEVFSISPIVRQNVIREFVHRLRLVRDLNGGHIENIVI